MYRRSRGCIEEAEDPRQKLSPINFQLANSETEKKCPQRENETVSGLGSHVKKCFKIVELVSVPEKLPRTEPVIS